jgi:poly(A) polymerase
MANITPFYDHVRVTSSAELAGQITADLRAHGFKAYLVGGCVRDLLLGIPAKDFDVATDAAPDQVLALYPDAHCVGAHFGVVLVCRGEATVEVATFRSDRDYADGRRPSSIKFESDPEQDALRRDFTINALFLDPVTNEVLDFVGGRADLSARLIRAIGNPETRFREDRLRMLRAVRFAARLGFDIELETENAIRRMRGQIHDVSAERIKDELVRILTDGNARRGFELLDRTGLLEEILPEVAAMKGVEQPPEFHPEGDVWAHTLMMLEGLPKDASPTLALGVLLHDVGKPPTFRIADRIRFDGHVEAGEALTREIMSRLRFSNDDIRQVEALVANHMKFKDAPRMKDSTLKRFLRLQDFDEHLELHRLDCTSSHGWLDNYEYVRAKREEFGHEHIAPPRLVTGKDLIERGYTPGPEFGRMLSLIEDAQLEGRVKTKEEAIALAETLKSTSEQPST